MKYLVRSLKYLVYFVAIFFIIVGIVYMFSVQKGAGVSFFEMFQENSGPKLIIFFIIVAATYPALGFGKRRLYLNGEFSKYSEVVISSMREMSYEVESQDESKIVFRATESSRRMSRMWEDAIIFHIAEDPVEVEGLRKDVARVLSTVSFKIRQIDEPQED